MNCKDLINFVKNEVNQMSISELMSLEDSVRILISNRRAELGYYDSDLEELSNCDNGEEWAEFLKTLVFMNGRDEDSFIHDMNNGRGEEWIDILKDYKLPEAVLKAFTKAVKKS